MLKRGGSEKKTAIEMNLLLLLEQKRLLCPLAIRLLRFLLLQNNYELGRRLIIVCNPSGVNKDTAGRPYQNPAHEWHDLSGRPALDLPCSFFTNFLFDTRCLILLGLSPQVLETGIYFALYQE